MKLSPEPVRADRLLRQKLARKGRMPGVSVCEKSEFFGQFCFNFYVLRVPAYLSSIFGF